MERGIQNVYILGEDEELIVRAKESFKDGEKERKPGDQWTIRGPGEYVPPVEVEVVPKRKTNPLDKDEVTYVRDVKTRRLQTPQVIAATQFQPGSVTIPSNASINLNLQQNGSVGKVSQLTPQQMQILQRKPIPNRNTSDNSRIISRMYVGSRITSATSLNGTSFVTDVKTQMAARMTAHYSTMPVNLHFVAASNLNCPILIYPAQQTRSCQTMAVFMFCANYLGMFFFRLPANKTIVISLSIIAPDTSEG